jgi:hypothetical protein
MRLVGFGVSVLENNPEKITLQLIFDCEVMAGSNTLNFTLSRLDVHNFVSAFLSALHPELVQEQNIAGMFDDAKKPS